MSDTVETVKTPSPSTEPPKDREVENTEPITKKDPRKVEQGKRLAAISKAAKERKMREKIENEMRSELTCLKFLKHS